MYVGELMQNMQNGGKPFVHNGKYIIRLQKYDGSSYIVPIDKADVDGSAMLTVRGAVIEFSVTARKRMAIMSEIMAHYRDLTTPAR